MWILPFLFILLIGIFVTNSKSLANEEPLKVSGVWTLETSITYSAGAPECICGSTCNNSLLGQSGTHSFVVSQTGNSFTSDSLLPATINGTVFGNGITWSIVGYFDCNDYLDFVGVLNGKTISGSFSGHDCGNNCKWGGNFVVTMDTCDFSIQPKIEKCFGGIGTQCKGDMLYFYKDENTCLVTGWMSVGSILHDRCCFINDNNGFLCDGFSTLKKINNCLKEFANAKSDVQCGNNWSYTFGPYPAGNTTGDNTAQDLRAPRGAQVHPQDESFCQAGRCQVDAKEKTIVIKSWNGCRSCVCE